MTLLNSIIERENLLSAWRKVRSHLFSYEGWVDVESIYLFEANLEENLKYIHSEFSKIRWKPRKMVPLPRLKRKKMQDGAHKEIIRQDFWVPVIDQVAWVAVVNIIGPILDLQMPGWSFANRIYRSIFYEEIDIAGEKDELKIGPYRHSPELLYRSWHKSWSLYRRLSYLTWIAMQKGKISADEINTLTEGDKRVYQNIGKINMDSSQSIPYLDKGYWGTSCDKIFYAKIDLENFYPLLKRSAVVEGIMFGLRNFTGRYNEDPRISDIEKLISQMMQFSWTDVKWANQEQTFLNATSRGIPVGLYVSGFLANVALLPIDTKLQDKLKNDTPKKIAHFRYVDDHIILSKDFKELISWILEYKTLLSRIGAKLNATKTEPKKLQKYLKKNQNSKATSKDEHNEDLIVDPKDPKAFFTQTLALISDIANKDFGLLHIHEQEFLLEQLKHLLVVPLEEDEIKNDTRMTFAIYRIIRLIVDWQLDWINEVGKQRDFLKGYKLNSLIAVISDQEFPDKDEYENIIAGAFKNLLKTTQQFPEKLRLWRLIVEYCKKTGYEGWRDLQAIFGNNMKPQYRFLKAIISLELGQQVLSTARALKIYKTLYSWEVVFQTKFLESIDNWLNILKIDQALDSYENITWEYLDNCIKLARHIINGDPVKFAQNRPVLYYWAEMNLTVPDGAIPSKLWSENILKLNSNNQVAKALLKLYPVATAKLSLNKFNVILREFKQDRTAWQWEGAPFTKQEKGKITLVEWCDWTKRCQDYCNKKNLYDPRISEWTSLEVVRQLIEIYEPEIRNLNDIKKYAEGKIPFPHPANFLVPGNWTKRPSRGYTWLDWESKIRLNSEVTIKVVSPESQITSDNRITPFWSPVDNIDLSTCNENLRYGIGIILLGLLRKSFNWPSRWNLFAYASDWRSISKEWFSRSACSSDTLFILQSLLLPRHRESIRIKYQPIMNYHYDDDKIYDPPLILSLKELKEIIEKAQNKLKIMQITSFRSLPRQLIPVSIPDLIKRDWLKNE